MDAGFQLFNLINEGHIQVYHYRFVTAVPQILPWLLLKLHAPLWMLGLSFSVSYILFYFCSWYLMTEKLKNERMGWVLTALFTFMALDSFYHVQSEFYLGLTLLLLLFGMVLYRPELKGWKFWLPAVALLITIGFSHKLTVIFFLFLWLFFAKSNPALRHRRYLILLASMLIVAFVKSHWFTNWYEAAKQVDFQTNWQLYFPRFDRLPSNEVLLQRLIRHYYLLPLLLLLCTWFYAKRKALLKLVMVWAFTLGYLLLYNISDPSSSYRFYSEVSYLPAILFVAVPLFFDLLPEWERSSQAFFSFGKLVFGAVVALRLFTIALGHQPFTLQQRWALRQLSQANRLHTNRLLMPSASAPADTVIMEWGIPFTTMHLTALENPDSAKTLLIMPDFERYEEHLQADNVFFSPFRPFPQSWSTQRTTTRTLHSTAWWKMNEPGAVLDHGWVGLDRLHRSGAAGCRLWENPCNRKSFVNQTKKKPTRGEGGQSIYRESR